MNPRRKFFVAGSIITSLMGVTSNLSASIESLFDKPDIPIQLETQEIISVAKSFGYRDHRNSPLIVAGILMQETHAGQLKKYRVAGNKRDPYFGLGQIKLSAAKDVMKAYPQLWDQYKFQTTTDDELRANLILNNVFNIDVTSKYLKLLATNYGFRGRQLINAYNRGPAGVHAVNQETFHYALGVEGYIRKLK